MKTGILSFLGAMASSVAFGAGLPYVGLYQTIDDATNTPKSIVALYEYNDGDELALAGRIVALYGADGKFLKPLRTRLRSRKKYPAPRNMSEWTLFGTWNGMRMTINLKTARSWTRPPARFIRQ